MVNHATVLIQHNGLNILTDPMWSERASPVSFTGPKRHRAPGVEWNVLPPIHLVLLSHNHYDHLDLPTVIRLAQEHRPEFVVPIGVGPLLKSHNITVNRELDWDDSVKIGDCRIHCVPAFHFSGRGPFDRNETLWCGYVIETNSGVIYFGGDSAFGAHFQGIREKHGAPRVALIPIGAYRPQWVMGSVHMDPEDAFRVHQILGARTSIGIHHGTFQLTNESLDTPAQELSSVASQQPGSAPFVILKNGESLHV